MIFGSEAPVGVAAAGLMTRNIEAVFVRLFNHGFQGVTSMQESWYENAERVNEFRSGIGGFFSQRPQNSCSQHLGIAGQDHKQYKSFCIDNTRAQEGQEAGQCVDDLRVNA